MLHIIIPMSGYGKRFEEAGYKVPKAFLPINDMPMFEYVIKNVTPPNREDCEITVIVRPDMAELLADPRYDGYNKVIEQGPIMGAAITITRAIKELGSRGIMKDDDEVLIANSDQFVLWYESVSNFLDNAYSNGYDASILTLPASEPKYSYAKVSEWYDVDTDTHREEVTRVAEKQVISPYGTVGIYWYKRVIDLVNAIKGMVESNDRFNNEFYLCPAYNYYPRHKTIGHMMLPKNRCFFLGDPAGYESFINKELGQINKYEEEHLADK